MDGFYVEWYGKKEVMENESSSCTTAVKPYEPGCQSKVEYPQGTTNRCLSAAEDTVRTHALTDTLPQKKNGKKHNTPLKFDERKNATMDNRKNHPFAVAGLMAGIISFSFLVWVLLGQLGSWLILMITAEMIASVAGLTFSFIAKKKIKAQEDKYDGWLLVKGGIILSLVALILGWLQARKDDTTTISETS